MNQYLDERKLGDEPPKHISAILKRMIRESVKVKAEVVTADEKEGGLRNLLNFGHSIGHGMEAILAPQILHGECVSIGMVKEVELSRYLGHLSAGAVARLTKVLASYNLPITLNDKLVGKRSANRKVPVEDVIRIMAVDKKNAGGKKRIVLLAAIGKVLEPKATVVADDAIRLVLSPAVRIHPAKNQPETVTCTPPGSKSISNRALVLAALGSGTCRIKNLLHSDDTQVMLAALTDLNAAKFSWEDQGDTLVVEGNGGALKAVSKELYLANAGTASRFLTVVAALAQSSSTNSATILTGNSRMKERPIGPLVTSLKANGVSVDYQEREGSLPVQVAAAGGLEGGIIELAATVSSQYVSALLMCAPYARSPVTLRLVGGKPISQAYVDMTTAMMGAFGVHVKKSTTEEHTYHIPKQNYTNPSTYEIESDASSATYPLAIAAITGTTCTIPNIGSASLQGDARFAIDVLRPMGCTVEQSKSSTTVTGPSRGTLQALPTVDMEPMTDAFLTACILAAVASPNSDSSATRITGIANQRVKECDRIAAMKDQLAKFGVMCREHEDGIEVVSRGLELQAPSGEITCYDDHRVAMSFSVLALVAPSPVLIEDRNCTAKTWPAWWDTLSQQFQASLEGVEPAAPHVNGVAKDVGSERSIFLIGMRGAGKSTAGRWAAPILDWPLIDLDEELTRDTGTDPKQMVRDQGWEHFRREETRTLKRMLKEKPFRHIFACGGGIVETAENRQLLKMYHSQGGLVLHIMRSIDDILAYLGIDKTRPAYGEDPRLVWDRRKPWYNECSNYQYYGTNVDALGSSGSALLETAERGKFAQFLHFVTGREHPADEIRDLHRSFFVSLTLPRLHSAVLTPIQHSAVGCDAVELRVDLLQDPSASNDIPSVEFVTKECAFLRSAVHKPLIFTIRTTSQGGKFPAAASTEALALYQTALRMGLEYIDLELTWPDSLLEYVTSHAGPSKIIASHHDPSGSLSWSTGAWISHYNRALQYGSIIKLIGFAHSMQTNDELETFRRWAQTTNPDRPLIALNMGPLGKLSRIRNPFMTPVSHPALPTKAASGQVSAAEIRTAMSLMGELESKRFLLFGSPISHSRSPALHNRLFTYTGLPHTYERIETDKATDVERTIRNESFAGASVTMPLKRDVMPLLDDVSDEARLIGAINTIVPTPRRLRSSTASNRDQAMTNGTGSSNPAKPRLVGYNTDWSGMKRALQAAGAISSGAGLVIGSGGTSRAAIYCLKHMGFGPIYLVGRTPARLKEVAAAFPAEYDIRIISDAKDADVPAVVAIGTIPADKPVDAALGALLAALLGGGAGASTDTTPDTTAGAASSSRSNHRVLLEMAYKPRQTELMDLAEVHGWNTVPGLEALTAQGVDQFRLWTGIDVEGIYDLARGAVLGE